MKYLLILTISIVMFTGACGGTASNSASNSANTNAANKPADAAPDLTVAPSKAADDLYSTALKGECTAVGEMLTDEMKKSVGTVETYCKSLTADGKIDTAKSVGASASSESASVSVLVTYKPEEKTEAAKPAEKKASNANAEDAPAERITPPTAVPLKTEMKDVYLKKVGEKWLVDVSPKPAAPAKAIASPAKPAK